MDNSSSAIFSLNLTYLLNLEAVREKFYCFKADILPPCMYELVAAIIWEPYIYRKEKISNWSLQSWFD